MRLKLTKLAIEMSFLVSIAQASCAAVTTTTILTVSPGSSVTAGTVVTLTATVTNPTAVTKGGVKFCNTSVPDCNSGIGLFGKAQLTRAGTATLKMKFGYGTYNIKAMFVPTTTDSGSMSSTNVLNVTSSPIYASFTTLAAVGSAGNYILNGDVNVYGNQTLTGTVSLLDTTKGNIQVGSALLGAPTRSLAAATAYATGSGPWSVAVDDFNGDGISDLVTSNNSSNTISVLLGNGNGTFQPQVTYATGGGPYSVAVADFNGDGISDLVVTNYLDSNVSVLLGNGNGTFQAQVTYTTGGSPYSVAVDDFNGDGIPDIVATSIGDHGVSVLLGNGNGTFRAQVTYATGLSPYSVAVADFNGDGVPDLAVANDSSDTVSVLLGNRDGTFRTQMTYATGNTSVSVAIGDFNGDGIPDLALANHGSNTASVLLGNGDGTFQSQATYETGTSPYSVAVDDFNGDGIPDLVFANTGNNTVSVLLGNGNGTFQSQMTYATGIGPSSLAIGDFNGDGIPDLAVASIGNRTVSTLLGEQVTAYTASGISILGDGTHSILASFGGDSSRTSSQSSRVGLTATLGNPTVALTSAPNPSSYGTPVTMTAMMIGAVEGINPTGTVTFLDGARPIGKETISGSSATITTASLAVGPHSITAVYGGDLNYNSATSDALQQNVAAEKSSMLLSASPNPSSFGKPVTFVASVTSGATGTVSFKDGTITIGTAPIYGSTATITIATLGAGAHSITALYGGDNKFAASASTPMIQAINKSAVALNITSSMNPSIFGLPVTIAASVTPGATGTVTFTDGATQLGIASINASGIAVVTTQQLAAGLHNIVAAYSGDENFF